MYLVQREEEEVVGKGYYEALPKKSNIRATLVSII